MTYSAAALQLAIQLPENHPLFQYILNNTKTLMSLTDAENVKPWMRFITLQKLAERNKLAEWSEWAEKYFSTRDAVLLISKSLLDMDSFLYQEVITQWPDEFFGYSWHAEYLIKKKRYSEAREIVLGGLDRKLVEKGLERITLHNTVADSFFMEGLYKEGLDYIEPYVEGMQNLPF